MSPCLLETIGGLTWDDMSLNRAVRWARLRLNNRTGCRSVSPHFDGGNENESRQKIKAWQAPQSILQSENSLLMKWKWAAGMWGAALSGNVMALSSPQRHLLFTLWMETKNAFVEKLQTLRSHCFKPSWEERFDRKTVPTPVSRPPRGLLYYLQQLCEIVSPSMAVMQWLTIL